MFDLQKTILIVNKMVKYQICKENELLSFKEVIQYWETNNVFSDFFNKILAESEFEAFFWEIPPMTLLDLNLPFEFVLVKSNLLSNISADEKAFRHYFSKNKSIVTFPNLGGDAQLIVPSPVSANENYSHLAKFIRHAPLEQKRKLWERISQEYQKRLGQQPVWLSTAGLGVSWLHLRIDSRPKYYRYQAYKADNYFSNKIL